MSEECRVGPHVVRYEPPDIIFVRFIGDITGQDVREITELCRSWLAGRSYQLILVDLSATGTALPDARSASREKVEYEMRGVAFFGASPRMRIMANLVAGATNILLKRQDNPVHFFANEAEARAWLSERRRKVLAGRR